MPPSTFSYTSADGTRIAADRWDLAGEPRAPVQLTHGMGEHARRYEHVARALNEAGLRGLRSGPPRPRRQRGSLGARYGPGRLARPGIRSHGSTREILRHHGHHRALGMPFTIKIS